MVAGSLPRGVSPEWLFGLLVRLKDLGLKVALDSSGMALRAGLAAGPWLIKPNTEELAEALDAPIISIAAQAEAAASLRARGIEHVVISQGSKGCMVQRRRWCVAAAEVPVEERVRGDSLRAAWSTPARGPRAADLRHRHGHCGHGGDPAWSAS